MSDPAFTRSDLFSIPAADDDPLAPLTRDIACALAGAGFTLRHCHRYDLLRWLCGVYLMPIPAESGTGPSGIAVSRTIHDLLLDWDWCATCSHTCQLMNAVPGSVLHASGYLDRQRGTGGTCLVTSHRGQRTEAGR